MWNKKSQSGARPWPLPLIALAGLTLAACAGGGSLTREIDRAERTWQAQHIDSYEIEVRAVNSIWHAQDHFITVVDGVPTSAQAECIPAPFEIDGCTVNEFDPSSLIVDALFETARNEVARDARFLTLEFDPTYGFPSLISFDDPDLLDEDWGISVVSFTPLNE